MNYKTIGKILGQILALEALFMLPAALICIYDGRNSTANAFFISMLIIGAVSGLLIALCHKGGRGFYAKEGLVCVGISWIVMSLLGCLPFYISGEIPHYIDAFFEIVSGFTTTGASILGDVESLSRGVLYWRSFSHWLGGMGVLVFLLAVVPGSKRGGGFTVHLLRAESPGPTVGKLVPKMRQTAVILYLLYILLTVADFIFLVVGDMPIFDAVCTAFGTAGTGGFGVKNDSMASYSPYLQNVTTIFMFLFGVNFNVYYWIISRNFKSILKNEEIRLYMFLAVASTVAIVLNIAGQFDTLSETIRHGAFQVVSVMTTTGFSTCDFNLWPSFSKTILLCLMFVGACAGSTGGGTKCSRIVLWLKSIKRSIKSLLQPQSVHTLRADGQPVSEKVATATAMYLVVYLCIFIGGFLLISLDGFSLETNLSAVAACFNNIGPGFDAVGPMSNYSAFSDFSKIILSLTMLTGRLELYPIIVLFYYKTWKS